MWFDLRDLGSASSSVVRNLGSGSLGPNVVRDSGSSESGVYRGTTCGFEIDSIHEFHSINCAKCMSNNSMSSDNKVSEHVDVAWQVDYRFRIVAYTSS